MPLILFSTAVHNESAHTVLQSDKLLNQLPLCAVFHPEEHNVVHHRRLRRQAMPFELLRARRPSSGAKASPQGRLAGLLQLLPCRTRATRPRSPRSRKNGTRSESCGGHAKKSANVLLCLCHRSAASARCLPVAMLL